MTNENTITLGNALCAQHLLPNWVPSAAQVYLAHTETGAPIRALARAAGCHASTILRQIRRIEMKRDDPLVDAALKNLSRVHFKPNTIFAPSCQKDVHEMSHQEPGTETETTAPLNGAQFHAD